MEGWIKIHRRVVDWEWFTHPNMLRLWIYLLVKASGEDREWRGITIKKGELVTSLSTISTETGIPLISVRRGLERLQVSRQVSIQTTQKWTKITICKYDSYQVCQNKGEQIGEHTDEQATEQHRKKKEDIYNKTQENAGVYAHAYAREQKPIPPTPFPKEDWRYLSSARKFSLGNNPDLIADYKRKLIADELAAVAAEINMPADAQERFLNKWCEHNPGNERIKADFEPTFNVRDRAIQWMGWWNSKERPKTEKQSSFDYYKDLMNTMNSRFGNEQQESDTGIPDEQ